MGKPIWSLVKLNNLIRKIPRNYLLGACLVTVLILGFLDYASGTELAFSIFYLGPILLAGWFLGLSEAFIISLCSATAMLTADWLGGIRHTHFLFHIWDGLAISGTLFIFSYLVGLLKWYVNQLKELARVDHLTGIANRRAFFETAETEILRARRNLNPLTVAYIDINGFKQINDQKGHSEGDLVLTQVAKTIQMNLRATDLVARLGGDEFGILLPHSNSKISKKVIQKMEDCLHGLARSRDWPIGFSIGAVTYVKAPQNTNEIVARADQLMYEVKREGRSGARHEIVEGEITTAIESVLLQQAKSQD